MIRCLSSYYLLYDNPRSLWADLSLLFPFHSGVLGGVFSILDLTFWFPSILLTVSLKVIQFLPPVRRGYSSCSPSNVQGYAEELSFSSSHSLPIIFLAIFSNFAWDTFSSPRCLRNNSFIHSNIWIYESLSSIYSVVPYIPLLFL